MKSKHVMVCLQYFKNAQKLLLLLNDMSIIVVVLPSSAFLLLSIFVLDKCL